jgi:hypothetical protein
MTAPSAPHLVQRLWSSTILSGVIAVILGVVILVWSKLARAAQLSLGLDPSTRSGPDSSDAVRRILGAVTTIENGLAGLRNRGLGTGHGPATARVGLGSRHAHLAVNAALTWCQLMLDTLADPEAPWRTGQS